VREANRSDVREGRTRNDFGLGLYRIIAATLCAGLVRGLVVRHANRIDARHARTRNDVTYRMRFARDLSKERHWPRV
jgi:hypothetical protein